MNAPVGPLLRSLAKRILANLDLVDQHAPRPGDIDQDRAPYSDTQLLISLLGVLVFPHERTPGALGRLLNNYEALSNVITIKYPKLNGAKIEICTVRAPTGGAFSAAGGHFLIRYKRTAAPLIIAIAAITSTSLSAPSWIASGVICFCLSRLFFAVAASSPAVLAIDQMP